MFTCYNCKYKILVGKGWNPPPCPLKCSNEIIESENKKSKCFFNPILCRCGRKIGIKVMSGLAN